MQLHLIAAVDAHCRNARNAGKAVGELVVHIIVKLVDRAVACQIENDDRQSVDVELVQDGRFHFIGKVLHDHVDLLTHIMERQIDIHSQMEFQRHGADIFHADRSRMLQTVQRSDRVLDPSGDFHLDLLRCGTGIDG